MPIIAPLANSSAPPTSNPGRLQLDNKNSSWNYNYYQQWGDQRLFTGLRVTFNGAPAVFVPAEYVEKGLYKDGAQYYSSGYLNKDIWSYLKPAQIDESLVPKTSPAGKQYTTDFSNGYSGYLIDEGKYKEFQANNALQTKNWAISLKGEDKWSVPIQGIAEMDGKLVYAGKRGGESAGEFTTYGASGGNLQAWKSGSSGFLGKIVNSPLGQLAAIAIGVPPSIVVAYNVGRAIAAGDWRGAALTIAMANLPGADGTTLAADSIFSIPAVAESVKAISTTLGVSPAMAGAMVTGTLEAAARGGNIGDAFTSVVTNLAGAEAGKFAGRLANTAGIQGLGAIASAVTTSSTKAMLLNQDVSTAATNAFVNTAVPLALQSTPGWDKLSATQQKAIASAAVSSAQGGKVDFAQTLKNYTTQIVADSIISEAGSGWSQQQKDFAKNLIMAGAQGRSVDSALRSTLMAQARDSIQLQVADADAQKAGWANYAQQQEAKKLYGAEVTPDAYATKQFEKQATETLTAKGYEPSQEEIRQLAADLKTTPNASAYLDTWYDQRTVTPEELDQFQKDTGVALTPEQQKGLVGKVNEAELVSDLTKLGQVTKQDEADKTARNNYLLGQIAQAYQDEGYPPELAQQFAQQNVTALAQADAQSIQDKTDYAAYLKSKYGADSAQYKDAAKDVLEAKATVGGYGVVKDQTGAYKTTSGATIDPASLKPATDLATSALKGAAESVFDFLIPSAQAAGQDRLVLPNPKETTEAQPQDYKFFFDLHANPDPAATYSGLSPEQKAAYDRASREFQQSSETRQTELLSEYRRGTLGTAGPSEQDILENIKSQAAEQDDMAAALAALKTTAGAGYVTPQEAAAMAAQLGYTPTSADELAQFTGQKAQVDTRKALEQYVNPRIVTAEEARRIYQDLGLPAPIEADVSKFTGQRDEAATKEEIEKYLPTAATNVLSQQVGQLGTQLGQLGTQLGQTQQQLQTSQQQLQAAQQQGNFGMLLSLLGGFGGQQAAPQPVPQAAPADIRYIYDIGGKSIFATPEQEKAFVTPYAEGGSVEDLMTILRG